MLLARSTYKEYVYLQETDGRLFADALTIESLQKIKSGSVLAEHLGNYAWKGLNSFCQRSFGKIIAPTRILAK